MAEANVLEKFEERAPEEGKVLVVQDQSPGAMIAAAVNQGADLDKLEKLLELQIRYEANEAKKDYHMAMADFKANLPPVLKDKQNKQYGSMYASESALLNTINPELSKHGLSSNYSFPKPESETALSVSCTITHKTGHSETITLSGPIDTSGAKNPLQQVKSTVTYLKKATFEAITGIASTDANGDDDGNSAGGGFIDAKQLKTISDMIKSKNVDVVQFLGYMGVEATDEVPAKDFSKAMIVLRKAKGMSAKREPGSDDE